MVFYSIAYILVGVTAAAWSLWVSFTDGDVDFEREGDTIWSAAVFAGLVGFVSYDFFAESLGIDTSAVQWLRRLSKILVAFIFFLGTVFGWSRARHMFTLLLLLMILGVVVLYIAGGTAAFPKELVEVAIKSLKL
jgi:uncharacterized membrane protein YuzA (DUF378 family)